MTPLVEAFQRGATRLAAENLPSPELQTEMILVHVLEHFRGETVSAPEGGEVQLTDAEAERFDRYIASRAPLAPSEALQQLLPFCSIDVGCTANSFVPRPDSMLLTDFAIQALRGVEDGLVYDVGTGVGAIALAIAAELPQLRVVGTDVDMKALVQAGLNHRERYAELSVDFVLSDLLAEVDQPAEAVIAVLPYASSDMLERSAHEVSLDPMAALDGGPDGLDLVRRLVPQAAALSPRLFLEVASLQTEPVADLMRQEGYAIVDIRKDFLGRNRYVLGFKEGTVEVNETLDS